MKLCLGTTCYVLGASGMQEIEELLETDIAPYVDISGTTCLGLCKDEMYKRLPCALIDGEICENATLPDLLQAIRKAVAQRRAEEMTPC